MAAQRTMHVRLQRELEMLLKSPPDGVAVWPRDDGLETLRAQIAGGSGTPYEGGTFLLDVTVPATYPHEPPHVQFATRVNHPNIDAQGRICLDILKTQPRGAWRPSINLATLMTSIQQLLAYPNPDDPLVAEIADEFRANRRVFDDKARAMVRQHAMESGAAGERPAPPPAASRGAETSTGAARPQDSEKDREPLLVADSDEDEPWDDDGDDGADDDLADDELDDASSAHHASPSGKRPPSTQLSVPDSDEEAEAKRRRVL